MTLARRGARPVDDPNIAHLVNTSAAKVAPAALVALYGMLTKGLPLVISLLTIFYLFIQISHALWIWRGERARRREADQVSKL